MGFNVIEASRKITEEYKQYLSTMFDIADPEYKKLFSDALSKEGEFGTGPYLDVSDSFEKGMTIKALVEESTISGDFLKLSKYKDMTLHHHQEETLRKSLQGGNMIVSTGTGSGKTECFTIPVLNELMREAEEARKKGESLKPGVRAILVYPMNALANDQVDRLRKTLIDYPEITFGSYTGQTKYTEKTRGKIEGAYEQYIRLNKKREDDIRLRTPLKNEILSRERMKKEPPHILITNYAMLEYLMLRPEDNVFFDGKYAKNWRFIILDEAHSYSGSTGIEVSMLLRRLQAKLAPSLKRPIQFFLTSATLGDEDSNEDVAKFAENLTGQQFLVDNIVRAVRIKRQPVSLTYKLDPDFYGFVDKLIDDGYEDAEIIKRTKEKYPNIELNSNSLSAFLFDLLLKDKTYWKIKTWLNEPKNVVEICKEMSWNEDELSSFVEVASRASKNGEKLFDSRYHSFLRASEGVFITLPPHKTLTLHRVNKVVDDHKNEWRAFEAVTCKNCHALYLLGYEKDHKLVQLNAAEDDEIKVAFYVGDEINDSDEDETLKITRCARINMRYVHLVDIYVTPTRSVREPVHLVVIPNRLSV